MLGALYAYLAFALAGLHWVYGSVAALLATLGGLLPDLDHPLGVELKGFTGILAVLASVAVWHRLAKGVPDLPFELHLWAVVLIYIFVRHWMRGALARTMVHRGISHSFPCCAAWGAAAYLYYPTTNDLIRLVMATAVMIGFVSHLMLDELCSVDITGARIKRSFGSAMKFWAPSLPATIAMYGLLSYLAYAVIQKWPAGSFREILSEEAPPLTVTWPPKPVPQGAVAPAWTKPEPDPTSTPHPTRHRISSFFRGTPAPVKAPKTP